MPVTAKKAANNQTIDSTGGVCFDPDPAKQGRVTSIWIRCRSNSANSLLVNVAGLHDSTEFDELEPGERLPFTNESGGIGKVTLKALDNTNNATASWSVAKQK